MSKTTVKFAIGIGTVGVLGIAAAVVAGRRFCKDLDALDQKLGEAQTEVVARANLPTEVIELATRMGASANKPASFVDLHQSGTMWFKPDGLPQRFTAQQRIGTSNAGFVWRAAIGLLGALTVVDSFIAGRGFLEARLFGAFSLARQDGTAELNQGEALRYLAEIPWNPDIILFDHALDWTVVGSRSLKVATGAGASRAEIAFGLDDAGLVETASAASRTFGTGKRYPWHGRFWDYQSVGTHRIPMQGEVAWTIDGNDFLYWRGKVESWQVTGADAVPE